MNTYDIYLTRLWPQCYVATIQAKDIWEAFAIAKASGVLNPIAGESGRTKIVGLSK